MEWLFWQVGGGPMLGQHGHFKLYAPDRIAYATNRYRDEALRLYGVLERQLAGSPFLAGEAYSIADMACWPWVRTWKAQDIPLDEYPAVRSWYDRLKQRAGLRRGVALGSERVNKRPQDSAETRRILFGIKEQDT